MAGTRQGKEMNVRGKDPKTVECSVRRASSGFSCLMVSPTSCMALDPESSPKNGPDYWTDNCRHLQVCTPQGQLKTNLASWIDDTHKAQNIEKNLDGFGFDTNLLNRT